ncbi:MAG: Crp/Fnr family transcriptional regulator [Dehalobacter sp. 4CP]|uniref:Crp/Fnr family transcriptional regulator n=1 Tax=Dehalobacter sp. CP TaxID=2594474 RepID=UPI0013C9145D|nr:Crp/Fnr family transcriptional regulator [Dehalobacter sp.]NBJ14328.1 Crp/Fnr family transcriptional regulator [Dehalobacter sp. 4CP]
MQENFEKWRVGIPDTFYPISELQKYVQYGTVKSYLKDSLVVSPGEAIHKFIYVLTGKLQVNFVFSDGRERMVYFGGKHCMFNYLFQYNSDNRMAAYIIALEDSQLCFFSWEQLEKIFHMDGNLFFEIMRNESAKCNFFMKQSAEMDFLNPTIRIVKLIYQLCVSQGKPVNNHIEVNIDLPLRDISEITGAHYVTVSKVFCTLNKLHILDKKRDKIVIFDIRKLEELTQETQLFKHDGTDY